MAPWKVPRRNHDVNALATTAQGELCAHVNNPFPHSHFLQKINEEEGVDAGGGTTVGAVADEVANASAEDKAAAAAMEYANYLDGQREMGWKD